MTLILFLKDTRNDMMKPYWCKLVISGLKWKAGALRERLSTDSYTPHAPLKGLLIFAIPLMGYYCLDGLLLSRHRLSCKIINMTDTYYLLVSLEIVSCFPIVHLSQ